MSQSHNDLVYLESPAAVERASHTATLSRMLHRKTKNKSKPNGSTSIGEPHAWSPPPQSLPHWLPSPTPLQTGPAVFLGNPVSPKLLGLLRFDLQSNTDGKYPLLLPCPAYVLPIKGSYSTKRDMWTTLDSWHFRAYYSTFVLFDFMQHFWNLEVLLRPCYGQKSLVWAKNKLSLL